MRERHPTATRCCWCRPRTQISLTLYDKLSFDFIRDIVPVASVISVPNVMIVNPSVPAKTVPEFIAYAKANPGKINMATLRQRQRDAYLRGSCSRADRRRPGGGGVSGRRAGADRLAWRTDAGHVRAHAGHIEYIRAGTLQALGGDDRGPLRAIARRSDRRRVRARLRGRAPVVQHRRLPRSTPPEVVAELNKEINAGLNDPKMKGRLADLGGIHDPDDARRVRQAHRRGNREVGQGGAGRTHQGGLADRFRETGRCRVGKIAPHRDHDCTELCNFAHAAAQRGPRGRRAGTPCQVL